MAACVTGPSRGLDSRRVPALTGSRLESEPSLCAALLAGRGWSVLQDGPAFTVEGLSVRHGDATLVEWSDGPDRRRMLVDGGPVAGYPVLRARLARLDPDDRHLDVVVLTHVDADHVEGLLKLLNDAELGITVGDVWFNGYQHLPTDELGGVQGDMLAALVEARGLPWNAHFGGGPVQRPTGQPPPVVVLPGGMRVTVLGPTGRELAALRPVWRRECRRAGLVAGDLDQALTVLQSRRRLHPLDTFLGAPDDLPALAGTATPSDTSEANSTSITLLLELDGGSALLTADATPGPLRAGLEQLLADRRLQTLDVDVWKVPHHGSERNVTVELVRLVRADSCLVSTDGSYHGHPGAVAMARLLCHGRAGLTVVFTHDCPTTAPWGREALTSRSGHRAVYPLPGSTGVTVAVPGRRPREVVSR